MKKSKKNGWSPYLAGCLAGIVLIFFTWLSEKSFNALISFSKISSLIERRLLPASFVSSEYNERFASIIDWQSMFLIGLFIGVFISAITSKTFQFKVVPDMWRSRYGSSIFKRLFFSFFGGMIAVFGAKLAGGCFITYWFSGVAQLALSGFITMICMLIGGMVMANTIHKIRRK